MNLDLLLPSRSPTFREEVAPRTDNSMVGWDRGRSGFVGDTPSRMGHPPEGHSQG